MGFRIHLINATHFISTYDLNYTCICIQDRKELANMYRQQKKRHNNKYQTCLRRHRGYVK